MSALRFLPEFLVSSMLIPHCVEGDVSQSYVLRYEFTLVDYVYALYVIFIC